LSFRQALPIIILPCLSYAGRTQKNGQGMNSSVKKRKCFPVFFRTNASPLGCTKALSRCSTGALLPCMRLHIANGGVGLLPMATLHRSMTAQQVRTHERSHVLHMPPHSRKASHCPAPVQTPPTHAPRRRLGWADRVRVYVTQALTICDALIALVDNEKESCICRIGSTTVLQS
jgi:hypothetical protein